MSNAFSCLSVWFSLHTTLIKAKFWLRGSIPVLSPLIRQEGCQLWALCCRLNSQTAPLNWTLELSMCPECPRCPALVFTEEGGDTGSRSYSRTVQQAPCIRKVDPWSVVSVRGLKRNAGCREGRGGNGCLKIGWGGHRQSGGGVEVEVGVIIYHRGSDNLMIYGWTSGFCWWLCVFICLYGNGNFESY